MIMKKIYIYAKKGNKINIMKFEILSGVKLLSIYTLRSILK